MIPRCRNCNITNISHCILPHPQKLNSYAYITKTYHEGKPLPIGTFVLKRHFAHVRFSDKLEPLRIGPYKFLIGNPMSHMNMLHKSVLHYTFIETI